MRILSPIRRYDLIVIKARFQEYVEKLSHSKPMGVEDATRGAVLGRRILSLPRPVDDAIMRITELLNPSQTNGLNVSCARPEQVETSTDLPDALWSYYDDEQDLDTLTLPEDFLRGYDWMSSLLDSSTE